MTAEFMYRVDSGICIRLCPACKKELAAILNDGEFITKRELLLEEVARQSRALVDFFCEHVMPPWFGRKEMEPIMGGLITALANVDEHFFDFRKGLLRAMQLNIIAKAKKDNP
jgi:hypothetical protein